VRRQRRRRHSAEGVEDGEAVLVTRFGKLVSTLKEPGLHFLAGRAFPWVGMHVVSLKRDFRHFQDVHVNDSRGTTVIVDLWLVLCSCAIPEPLLMKVKNDQRNRNKLRSLDIHLAKRASNPCFRCSALLCNAATRRSSLDPLLLEALRFLCS
jgi:hypothetical protein